MKRLGPALRGWRIVALAVGFILLATGIAAVVPVFTGRPSEIDLSAAPIKGLLIALPAILFAMVYDLRKR